MIREACLLDLPRIGQLGKEYIDEVGFDTRFPLDLDYANLLFAMYINRRDSLVLVAVHKKRVVGFFMGAVATFPWSQAPIGMDNLLYIQPEYRGLAHGVRLIKRYEAWAREVGCKEAQLSTASGIEVERTCDLFERLGYTQTGIQFMKEL